MTGRGGWVDPYAGMPGRRLFIAVPLPAGAVEAVARVVDSVRAMPLPDGSRDVRWVRLDGLHLTLRFLGPTPEDRVGQTSAAMASVAARTLPSMGQLAGSGVFPLTGMPRTLWIGVVEGAAAFRSGGGAPCSVAARPVHQNTPEATSNSAASAPSTILFKAAPSSHRT